MKKVNETELADAAFGQNLITVNEYRKMLGLPAIQGGDVCKNKVTIQHTQKKINFHKSR